MPPDKTDFIDTTDSLLNRYFYLILSGILLLALILRIAALFSLKESIYFDFLLWDERLYHNWAEKIAKGMFQSSAVYEMAPLPAYFMALVYKIFSPDVLYIRITNIVFGVTTCALVYLIGKELASRKVGFLACLMACIYEPFILYSIVPLKTSLSLVFFASMVYLFVSIINRPSWIKAFFLGISIGLVQNVRPNCIVLVPLLPLLIAWIIYKGKSTLVILTATLIFYALGLCASNAPFMIRNYRVAGETSATVSQSGFNLYMCNNLEYGYPLPFAATSPFEQGIHFTIEASRRNGKKLTPGEASSFWHGEIIKTAQEQPGSFTRLMFRKTLALFNQNERGDHYHIKFLSNFVDFFKFPLPGIWLILPFGMAGLTTGMFVSRKYMALSAVFFLYAATLIVFFINIRVRLPLLIILMPFAAMGICNTISYIREKQLKKTAVFSAITLCFFVIVFIPMKGAGDMTSHHNTHAIILDSKGLEDEAIKYWEKSSQMERRFSDFANLALANKFYKRNNMKKAIEYINKISNRSFAAAQKYAFIGDLMVRQNKLDVAIDAYERSLDINSSQILTRKKLIKILSVTDKQKSLEETETLNYISSFYNLY